MSTPVWLIGITCSTFPLFAIHFSMFILYAMHTVNIEQLVNALLGVLACIRLFASPFLKAGATVLSVCFLGILLFSSPFILAGIAAVSVYFGWLQRMENKRGNMLKQISR
ncbi:hypothetical protein ACFFMS_20100 [Ectobacillus funiculus]|uniref:Chromate transporter n=1 Tax=Ectobacillus funiculus TaxID=137993 RepID=A0ABV5WJ44_9BACI